MCTKTVKAILTRGSKVACEQANDDRSEQPVSIFCWEKGVQAGYPNPPSVYEHPGTVSEVPADRFHRKIIQILRFRVSEEAHLA